jgi:hypothetical protein
MPDVSFYKATSTATKPVIRLEQGSSMIDLTIPETEAHIAWLQAYIAKLQAAVVAAKAAAGI